MTTYLSEDIIITCDGLHHSRLVAADAHRLELVADVDLGRQALEQDHHLLINALAVLRHQRQDLHGRMLAPLVPCGSQCPSASAEALLSLASWRTRPAVMPQRRAHAVDAKDHSLKHCALHPGQASRQVCLPYVSMRVVAGLRRKSCKVRQQGLAHRHRHARGRGWRAGQIRAPR